MPNNLDANWKAPSNRIVEEALSDPYAESQELQAYISKKNTRGYFQSRYFVTQGRKLSYYNDENIYTEEQKLIYADKDFNSTATEYDIVAMRVIELAPDRILHIKFSNNKFKLDLQFKNETERNEWTTLLLAKKNLHNVQELVREVRSSEAVILTPTFQNLLILEENDQDSWIEQRIDDIFEAAYTLPSAVQTISHGQQRESHSNSISQSGSDFNNDNNSNGNGNGSSDRNSGGSSIGNITVQLLKCSRIAMNELMLLCEDCLIEMGSRHPRVGIHAKSYVQRYAKALKGRCLLELQVILLDSNEIYSDYGHGPRNASSGMCSRLVDIGIESINCALNFTCSLERLRKYTFLPKYIQSFHDNLFSTGELVSTYLNITIDRVEIWFRNLLLLKQEQRGNRIGMFYCVINEILSGAKLQLSTNTSEVLGLGLGISNININGNGNGNGNGDISAGASAGAGVGTSSKTNNSSTTNFNSNTKVDPLQQSLIDKLATTLLLTFADQLRMMASACFDPNSNSLSLGLGLGVNEVEMWDQRCLLQFINGLQTNIDAIVDGYIYYDPNYSKSNSNSSSNGNGNGSSGTSDEVALEVSSHAADAYISACRDVSTIALYRIVSQFTTTLTAFSKPLFQTKLDEDFVGDQAIAVLLSHIKHWYIYIKKSLPSYLISIVHVLITREALNVYITDGLVLAYKSRGRKGYCFNMVGLNQVLRDLSLYEAYFNAHDTDTDTVSSSVSASSDTSGNGNGNGSGNGSGNCTSDRHAGIIDDIPTPEMELINYLKIIFKSSDTSEHVLTYAKGLMFYGINYFLHLYDIHRLVLKLRSDIQPKQRHEILELLSIIVTNMKIATSTDIGLLHGIPVKHPPHILCLLCPTIAIGQISTANGTNNSSSSGISNGNGNGNGNSPGSSTNINSSGWLHITGSKWSIETPTTQTINSNTFMVQTAISNAIEYSRILRDKITEHARKVQISARSRVNHYKSRSKINRSVPVISSVGASSGISSTGTSIPTVTDSSNGNPWNDITGTGTGTGENPWDDSDDASETDTDPQSQSQPSFSFSVSAKGRVLSKRGGINKSNSNNSNSTGNMDLSKTAPAVLLSEEMSGSRSRKNSNSSSFLGLNATSPDIMSRLSLEVPNNNNSNSNSNRTSISISANSGRVLNQRRATATPKSAPAGGNSTMSFASSGSTNSLLSSGPLYPPPPKPATTNSDNNSVSSSAAGTFTPTPPVLMSMNSGYSDISIDMDSSSTAAGTGQEQTSFSKPQVRRRPKAPPSVGGTSTSTSSSPNSSPTASNSNPPTYDEAEELPSVPVLVSAITKKGNKVVHRRINQFYDNACSVVVTDDGANASAGDGTSAGAGAGEGEQMGAWDMKDRRAEQEDRWSQQHGKSDNNGNTNGSSSGNDSDEDESDWPVVLSPASPSASGKIRTSVRSVSPITALPSDEQEQPSPSTTIEVSDGSVCGASFGSKPVKPTKPAKPPKPARPSMSTSISSIPVAVAVDSTNSHVPLVSASVKPTMTASRDETRVNNESISSSPSSPPSSDNAANATANLRLLLQRAQSNLKQQQT
jgi:hypothetical protein